MARPTKEQQNLRLLRRVVISMGILLIFGTISLFIAIAIKAASESEQKVVYNAPQPKKPEECNYKATEIPTKSPIVSATTNNNILTIVTEEREIPKRVNSIRDGDSLTMSAEKTSVLQQVIVYDLCSGGVLSRIDVVSGK